MNPNTPDDIDAFAAEEIAVEELPDTGALGSWGSAGTMGSTVGSCASSCSTASTFS